MKKNLKNNHADPNAYTNQNCLNYNNYMMNSNYGMDSLDDDTDELSRLGTEYAQELAFNTQVKKSNEKAFEEITNRKEKYCNDNKKCKTK